MKRLIILVSLLLISIGYASAQVETSEPETTLIPDSVSLAESFTCSMHPEIISDKPGTCPKCGMDLVQKTSVQYTCPMHPEVTSMKPAKCPKCEMKLKKTMSQDHKMIMGCCK